MLAFIQVMVLGKWNRYVSIHFFILLRVMFIASDIHESNQTGAQYLAWRGNYDDKTMVRIELITFPWLWLQWNNFIYATEKSF
jgi:hypothetical protein